MGMDDNERKALEERISKLQREKVELSRKLVEIRMINETFKDINSTLDLDKVLEKIIQRVAYCLEAEIGSVLLLDEDNDELFIAASEGLDDQIASSATVAVGKGISGWVAGKGEPLLVNDIEADPRFGKGRSDDKYTTKSLISAPLISRGKVMGVINVNNKSDNTPFDEADLDLLINISNQAAIAIENARLYAEALNARREMDKHKKENS